MISVAIPYYKGMKNADFFMERCLKSVRDQTYQDFEIVITKKGTMAENTNEAIRQSKGELIKILYMDDYLAHKEALKDIVGAFKGHWLATGCLHDDGVIGLPHYPVYSPAIEHGVNTIGSPSVITIRNKDLLFFDEEMTWLLDVDYYKRMFDKFGEPVILNSLNVVIGKHEGQKTNTLTDEEKHLEERYLRNKYDTSS